MKLLADSTIKARVCRNRVERGGCQAGLFIAVLATLQIIERMMEGRLTRIYVIVTLCIWGVYALWPLYCHSEWRSLVGTVVVLINKDGITYVDSFVRWSQIAEVTLERNNNHSDEIVITKKNGETMTIEDHALDYSMDYLYRNIKRRIGKK